uniref:SFRICE_033372 n=1 Tax=Spodoptera frugiperda TaxID=7108 RepID=A0A2H1V3J8_SPOFR
MKNDRQAALLDTFVSLTAWFRELMTGYLPCLFTSMSFRYFGTVASAMITDQSIPVYFHKETN